MFKCETLSLNPLSVYGEGAGGEVITNNSFTVADMNEAFKKYIREIRRSLRSGRATEHTHRPALKALIESLGRNITATNEPRREACGAPDYIVTTKSGTIGYIEAKDIGASLDAAEKSDQMKRYLPALNNLILTDYLEFRWFVDGQRRAVARLGVADEQGNITPDKAGVQGAADLLSDYLAHEAEGIAASKELARRMARVAHMIRDLIERAFEGEQEGGSLHGQFKAFEEVLLPDLTAAQFADMYAQTIVYGLFAACCEKDGAGKFTREKAAYLIPRTNPFLRRLFNEIAGLDLDDRIAWLVDDLAEILDRANMESVLRDFGKRTAREDPVVHFYETFLSAYDPAARERRGVYYTPEPVVSYIVRSVDHLLKTRFGRPQGLADEKTLILDPAAGTGTFLYFVINEIYEALRGRGQAGAWNEYVAEKLLPRIFGFELLMAPYAVAHMKLGLLLKELGYSFDRDERLGIYLTNTLEEAVRKSELLFAQYIAEEANAATEIKKDKPIMVVLGNPPYSGHSANRSYEFDDRGKRVPNFIGRLVREYYSVDGKPLGERNPKWLQDDYVKFIRWGQWRIERTGQGILAFITNHGYLDNPTFRGMRQSLMKTFDEIYILDLHGNVKKKEHAPDGSKDENVFDIQQGVSIGIFIRRGDRRVAHARVYHADIWGIRKSKEERLFGEAVSSTEWQEIKPQSPFYLFIPQDTELLSEYQEGFKITEIFPVNSVGIVTARDRFTIHWSPDEVWKTVKDFSGLPIEAAREKYKLGRDVQDWKAHLAQEDIKASGPDKKKIVPILYRPFDVRHTYYTGKSRGFICRPRPDVMRHMLKENLALHICRQIVSENWKHVWPTNKITDDCYVSNITRERGYTIPLYLYTDPEKFIGTSEEGRGARPCAPTSPDKMSLPLKLEAMGRWPEGKDGRVPNLDPDFVAELEKRLGLRFIPHPPAPSPPAERGFGGEVSAERGSEGWQTSPELWARLKPMARQMRTEPTAAENLLWQRLRNRQLLGFKFRRQHSIERFIVDFYCAEAGLVVEVEGSIHQYQQEEDQLRQAYLESRGLNVLRFSNDDVMNRMDQVLNHISDSLSSPSSLTERGAGGEVITETPTRPSPHAGREREPEGEVFTPEDIFNYIYAIFHSPAYRERYAEFLKMDFPRVPLTSDKKLFKALAEKGAELVSLHLTSPSHPLSVNGEGAGGRGKEPMARFDVGGSNVVEKVTYTEPDGTQGRVYINKEQYFEGIDPEVWGFHIGGYQVCHKWLKDRRGRKLSYDDITHYQKIVAAIKETIRLMSEIDALIPSWPMK